jgi:RNA polymerase sigma-70 factor, ECF subfamily
MAQAGMVGALQVTDERAFANLLEGLVEPGYRLACAMLHDPYAAEDVVQDASVVAWRKIAQLVDGGRARSWFLGIVANECRNARRRKWSTSVTLDALDQMAVSSDEERLVRRSDLRRALMRLNRRDRLVVSLYFYLDLPIDEIADVAGCSVGAARVRLHRSVRRLRPDLDVEEALR